jgi:hypothetical protein
MADGTGPVLTDRIEPERDRELRLLTEMARDVRLILYIVGAVAGLWGLIALWTVSRIILRY